MRCTALSAFLESSLMQIENQTFYGRQQEIDRLFQSWLEARAGKPQWVNLVGETGTGKTRLVHEFYRYISDVTYRHSKASAHSATVGWHENFDTSNYWPDQLPMASNMLGLNPDADGLTDEKIESLKDIPWLWWGMRGDPQRRNGSENGCAASVALGRLETHAALLALQKRRLEANLAAGYEISKFFIPGLPAVGPFLELVLMAGELIWAGKNPLETLLRGRGIHVKQERRKQQVKLQDMLVDLIMQFLKRDVPVVLILDDIHFFDADSHDFLNKLSKEVAEQACKLMIISTSWAKEWCDGASCPGYETFKGDKPPVALGMTDREHVRQFLLSHFPGLNADDQQLLADRANGNFGYATELVLALEADVELFFEGKSFANSLSANGRRKVGELSLEMDKLVYDRFQKLVDSVKTALMRSSYQGARFDPGLTARVTGAVDRDDPGASATLAAIASAEKPGAMVCSLDADMREFLQGPYWRLIRERLGYSADIDAIEEAYRQLVTTDDAALDDGIVESLVGQWLTSKEDPDQLHWRACLLELAARGRRYHAGLRHLSAMADLMLALGKRTDVERKRLRLSPRTVLAALRIFNQYAFGEGDQNNRKVLQNFCVQIAEAELQTPIRRYLHEGILPQGCDVPDLIAWCEALVGLRQSLGHMHSTAEWLGSLVKLLDTQGTPSDAVPNARFPYAVALLRLAEAYFPYYSASGLWDKLQDLARRAEAETETLTGAHRQVVSAWAEISKLRFGAYHDVDVDIAIILGRVLNELESVSSTVAAGEAGEFDDELLEVLVHAASLDFELAVTTGYVDAAKLRDRIQPLLLGVFSRIEAGAYVPVSLTCEAMNAELAAAIFHAGPSDAEVGAMLAGETGRKVARIEALNTLERLATVMARHRQLGMLSMDIISLAGRANYYRLLWSEPDADQVMAVFDAILADAVLAQEGLRARYSEPVQLLELLLRIYFRWLQDGPDADPLWERLRMAYADCPESTFNQLVDLY